MILRPYQQEALDALLSFFQNHPDPGDNPVIALPTGAGKAPLLCKFCHMVMTWWPGQRILQLVHVKELVEQNAATMRRMWPQAPLGVFSAGLGQRVAHMPLTFAGTKSVANNLKLFGKQDLLIVDECHLIPENEESDYLKVISYFRALNPRLRVIGLSATPYRVGRGRITDGKLFSHLVYDATNLAGFNRLLDDGYLCRLVPIKTELTIDTGGVGTVGGDYAQGQLQAAVNRESVTRGALKETLRAAAYRRHWLIFAAGVEHAEAVGSMLRVEFGVSCVVVHGKMSSAQRDEALRCFKAGEVRACVNNNILTTGFDFPALDCVVMLRPTKSVVLHVQMLGRLTRPCYAAGYDLNYQQGRLDAMADSHKRNGLVLDFAGNVSALGPINDPRIPKRKGEKGGEIPVKLCVECGCLNHIVNRFCDNCGTEFPLQVKITEKASTAQVIAKQEPPQTVEFTVDRRTFSRHVRPGKPLMLKVCYYCGLQRFEEYVLLEHYHNSGRKMAEHWWHEQTGQREYAPATVEEAEQHLDTLRVPTMLRVWVNTKRPEILDRAF